MTHSKPTIHSKFRKLAAQLPYFPKTLRLVISAAPGYGAAWGTLLLVQGLLPIAMVYLTRALVNGFVDVVRGTSSPYHSYRVILLIATIAALTVTREALRVGTAVVRTAQAGLIQDRISGLIHQKSVEADMAFYDNAEFYDHLHRARSEGPHRPLALLENLGAIVQNGLTLISMLAVLSAFRFWLPAALFATTLPALYIVIRHALDQHYWRVRETADERRSWYYDWLLTSAETGAELRLFGLGQKFQRAFQDIRTNLRAQRLRLAKKQASSELFAGSFGFSAAGLALAWMAWQALRHQLTLGDLALFFQAFQQGSQLSRSLLDNVGQVYSNALFLGDLFEFLGLESKISSPRGIRPVMKLEHAIRFRSVCFRYPGAQTLALCGLDLEIAAKRITAIVGTNGAGKSTLLKLLCRFYDPEEGSIELDGIDLRKFDLNELRGALTVLFQQPVHYNTTAVENIALGHPSHSANLAAVRTAAESAGAADVINNLPDRYNQLLGRRFENGMELSTGEWQRIALARAFLRKAPIVILDEPTSAMDPWAEADWLTRFQRLAVGHTVIVITHRFTTAMIADTIHVMSDGQLLESGSHEQLLQKGGLYSRGWWDQNASYAV